MAHDLALIEQIRIGSLTRDQIIVRLRELNALNAIAEGEDNAARYRGLSMRERAVLAERDAATDLERAALMRECAVRGITVEDL